MNPFRKRHLEVAEYPSALQAAQPQTMDELDRWHRLNQLRLDLEHELEVFCLRVAQQSPLSHA